MRVLGGEIEGEVIVGCGGHAALLTSRQPWGVVMVSIPAALGFFSATAFVHVRVSMTRTLMTGLPARGTGRCRSVPLLCFGIVFVSCSYIVAVCSSPPHKDIVGGEPLGLPAIARRIWSLIFASLKKKRERDRGGRTRGRGRAQQQLDGVVCAAAVKSRMPELFCQAFSTTSV